MINYCQKHKAVAKRDQPQTYLGQRAAAYRLLVEAEEAIGNRQGSELAKKVRNDGTKISRV